MEQQAAPADGVEHSGRKVNRAFGDYRTGMDGIRGIGMAMMLGFHGRIAHTSGAFFALSQFFTVSGFLITALLLSEQVDRGGIDLRAFWSRRIRRLAPAALLGLVGAVIFGATIATPGQADALPGEIAGALVYIVNWVFVWQDRSYVDLFSDPSPIQHYWSLAIEEQFYVVLPLILIGLRRAGARTVQIGVVLGVAAIAGSAWTWTLFERGVDIDRLYYGTDTRISELLVGATFAVVLHGVGYEALRARRRIVGAVAVPAVLLSWWLFATGSVTDAFTWRGGYLLHALLTLVILAAVVAGGNPVDRFYSLRPIAWFGRLAYSVYVFHWPLFLWLDADRTGLRGWPLFAVRVAATVLVASASYRWIEQPIRRGFSFGSARPVWTAAAVPVVGAGILLASTLVVTGHGTDPTATFAGDPEALPVASADGTLDLVVVHSGDMSDVAGAIESRAADRGDVDVGALVPLACPAIDATPAGASCPGWEGEWPDIVERHDPDTILLLTDAWEGADLAPVVEATGRSEADIVTDVLRGGVEVLTSAGATVLWSSSGADWMALGAQQESNPLIPAVFALDVEVDGFEAAAADRFPSRDQVDPEAFVEGAAEALVEDAALHQRGGGRGRTRVLILGDSQARSLGYGFERWGDRTGLAWVWNAATPGCGLIVEGKVVQADGRESDPDPRCVEAVEDQAGKAARFEPDVVLVLSGSWDLEPRRLDGDVASPGDDVYDAMVHRTYVSLVDDLEASGASVVWFLPPCAGSGLMDFATPDLVERYIAPLPALQHELVPALAEARPSIELFDMDSVLCSEGEAVGGGGFADRELRPDGLHFSVEGSTWFADEHADEILRLAGVGG